MGWPPTTEQSILMAAKLKLKLLAELEVDEGVTGRSRAGRGSSASKGRDRAGRDSSSDRSCISGRSGSGSGTSSGYSGGAGGAVEAEAVDIGGWGGAGLLLNPSLTPVPTALCGTAATVAGLRLSKAAAEAVAEGDRYWD
eukprot:CAMPEP_0173268672 /NCGR_PEP_ID=MMETSP1142-20121109/30450_1 /TAXON_ID=483371 /ORGANISM="non described non described, Strain CCMP2298" /LENGTH=139 /DNA_ID=CAMNT_0014204927 /DNA_START=243 /DNA_END=663 /DNA_ORIENTATION=-